MRQHEANIDRMFIERWSPRSFDSEFKMDQNTIDSLLEAARWSPSCFNEQPWNFFLARREDEHFEDYLHLLNEKNRKWAKDAALLGFIVAKRSFQKTGEPNDYARFDCGAAWMALTMQARGRGLHTHGMAGIKHEQIYAYLNLPKEEYDVICGFVVGERGQKEKLPEDLQKMEHMNGRKHSNEFTFYGKYTDKKMKH